MWYFSIFTLFFVGFVNATEVTSYDKLVEELSNNSEANVVFDNKGNNVDLGGNPGFNVLENQKVELKNIDAWMNKYTETVQNYPLNNTTNKAINISNSGILSIDNVKFKNNEIYVDPRLNRVLGSIVRNPYGHITGITNSIFDNNKVDGEAFKNTFFGGLIINGENEQTNAKIDLIQNVKFTNNFIKSGLSIHGGVIYNTGMIGLIDNVLFENNISQTAPNTWGSLQGGAIDNNDFGVIKKISNSTFRGNKSIRTGYEDAPSGQNYHAGGSAINNMYTIEEIENVIFEDNSVYGEATDSVGGAITNHQEDVNDINQGYIGKITNSKFINNNVYSELGFAYGGAIFNIGDIKSIYGRFEENYAKSELNSAEGGAINNKGSIEHIKADFVENRAISKNNNAHGGAIINFDKIASIDGNFEKNYAKSENGSVSGGGIYNNGYTFIDKINGTFEKNYVKGKTSSGGAISTAYNATTLKGSIIGEIRADFIENYSEAINRASAGAIDNNGYAVITEGITGNFKKNYAVSTGGNNMARGGAIVNFGNIKHIIGDFENNYAKTNGTGAVGGAIFNTYNDGSTGIGKLTGKYTNNYALSEGKNGYAYGGAIYNNGARSFVGIENSIFNGNFAEAKDAKGGAIYNTGIIDFGGKNTFSENFVLTDGNKIGNSIYNGGIINIKENSLLDIKDGIDGNNGVINVAQNGIIDINNAKVSNNELNLSNGATFRFDLIQPKTNGLEQIGGLFNGNINLNGQNKLEVSSYINNGELKGQGEYKFADSVNDDNGDWNLIHKENGLYNVNVDMKVDDNKNKLVMQFDRKTSDEVVESLDVSKENADVILAVTGKETDNEEFNLISDNINELAQSKNANIEKTVNKLKDNPKAQLDTIKDVDDALIRTVNKHLSILQNSKSLGMASGDVNTKKIQLWGTTLYQKAKDASSNGFSADTQGVVIGGDVNLNDNLLVGAGFSLQQTDLTSDNKKADIDSKSLFIYGEYSKDDWFVKPILSLNKLEYKQNKSVLGLNIGSKYDAEMIGAQFMVGKNMYYQVEENKYKIRPTVGFRYYHINKDGYTDSAGFNYEKSQNDILTTVLGIEVSETIKIKDISVLPIVYLNMTYDIVNDDIETLVRLPNGNSYITNSDNNEKLGFELGVSTEFNINDKIKMAVTYEYDWKKDYSSHLGLLKLKYQF